MKKKTKNRTAEHKLKGITIPPVIMVRTVDTVGVTYFQQMRKYKLGFLPIMDSMFSENLSTPGKREIYLVGDVFQLIKSNQRYPKGPSWTTLAIRGNVKMKIWLSKGDCMQINNRADLFHTTHADFLERMSRCLCNENAAYRVFPAKTLSNEVGTQRQAFTQKPV